MLLTLEDSARIHVYVFAEDGKTLFYGNLGIEKLRRKLNSLLEIESDGDNDRVKDARKNPSWICVCLIPKSWKIHDRMNVVMNLVILASF